MCDANHRTVLVAVLLLSNVILLGSATEETALTADRVLSEALDNFNSDRTERVRLVNFHGETRGLAQEMEIAIKKSDGEYRMLGTFISPENVRGMAFLILPGEGRAEADERIPANDYFVYLPALRKPRRISGAQRADSFFGTQLSQGDVEPHPGTHYRSVSLRESWVGAEPVFVVEAVPLFQGGYDRVAFTIAKRDRALLRVEEHRDGQELPIRRIEARREWVEEIGGHALPAKLVAVGAGARRSTEVTFFDRRLDADIPDTLFSVSHLQKGRSFGLGSK